MPNCLNSGAANGRFTAASFVPTVSGSTVTVNAELASNPGNYQCSVSGSVGGSFQTQCANAPFASVGSQHTFSFTFSGPPAGLVVVYDPV